MGLFDSLVNQLTAGGQGALAGSAPNMLHSALDMIHQHPEGLAGLVNTLNQAGLGQIVQSWIGNGPNLPISPQQLQGALGPQLQQFAQGAGLTGQDAAAQLSTLLPHLVDKLTPNGQLPSGGLLQVAQGLMGNLGNLGGLGNFGKQ